jgi:uncharacterized membrane protein SpoIIM required for sporulation
MVLEAVVVPESWERHPGRMFFIGFLYASLGMFLGVWVFGKYSSISGIFLTTIPLVVIMYRALACEEEKDLKICKEYLLIKEHLHILWFFLYLFLGLTLAYTFWYTFLPVLSMALGESYILPNVSDKIFSSQIDTINSVRVEIETTGAAISKTGQLVMIMENNIKVLAFCVLFSFIYGAGAIFILTWNASVIGVAIGNVIREGFKQLGVWGGNPTIEHYFIVLPMGFSYLIHGIPEITSYFLGSLAGGIISAAVACHHWKSKNFQHIVWDSIDLTLLSVIILVLAGLIEVYITPVLF